MKKQFFILIAVMFSLQIQAQEYYALGGTTFSIVPNHTQFEWYEQFGYYAGVGYTNKISDKAGFLGELQFVHQRAEPFTLKAFVGTFAFRFPVTDRITIDPGFQVGKSMWGVIGVNYSFVEKLERFRVICRYNHRLGESDYIFKGYGQMGIAYKFN